MRGTHKASVTRATSGGVLLRTIGPMRAALLIGVLLIGLGAQSLWFVATSWPYQSITWSDGTMLGVFRDQSQIRLVTFYIGMAARDAAGGVVTSLRAPKNLESLAVYPEAEGTIGAYSGYYLQQMSGFGLVQTDYDVTLTAEEIERLRAGYEFIDYPRNVVAVVSEDGDGRVVLFTDEAQEYTYCVPESVAELELGR